MLQLWKNGPFCQTMQVPEGYEIVPYYRRSPNSDQTELYHSFGRRKEFVCKDGTVLPFDKFCDGVSDCDGSDEIATSWSINMENKISCKKTFQPLYNRSCFIDPEYICNNSVTCEGVDKCDAGCTTHYRCQDSSCAERSALCGVVPGRRCPENHGWESGIGFKCVRNSEVCLLPQQLLRDDVKDCDQGEDLCYDFEANVINFRDHNSFSASVFNHIRCFQCLDDSTIIPRRRVCDGIIDCPDLSDECLCEANVSDICNHVIKKDSYPPLKNTSCTLGQVSCGNGTCINRTSVCDSIRDCEDTRDERYSYCGGTLRCSDASNQDKGDYCRCSCSSGMCSTSKEVGTVCDGKSDCNNYFPEDECNDACYDFVLCESASDPSDRKILCVPKYVSANYKNLISPNFCDGIEDCMNGEDEQGCSDRFSCSSGRFVSIPKYKVCDGIEDCDIGADESKLKCGDDRFFCNALGKTKVSIERKRVCDLNINCDDGEDELNCPERFYCENADPLFVLDTQMLNGHPDCSDLSDECPTNKTFKKEDAFSSIYHLIRNPILRSFVWILGLLTVIGNAVVIIGEVRNLSDLFGKEANASAKTNHLLVLNLAIADLMMGVYLNMLGIAGAVYSGNYCAHEMEWRTSSTCTAMGVIVSVSSEASVMTLVLMTSLRLFAVVKPFSASTKPSRCTTIALMLLSWVVALTLALIPLSTSLQFMFSECAVLPNNPFFHKTVVCLDAAKNLAKKLFHFDPNLASIPKSIFSQIDNSASWLELQLLVENTSSARFFETSSYFGYYSASSVCIPQLFVTRQNSAWQFSLAVTIFNFLAFAFVAIAYIIIVLNTTRGYLITRKQSTRRRSKLDEQSKAMERKVARFVVTDFCCWVPISVMAFINFSGVELLSEAYVVSAIILLPINSALNPILYSSFIESNFLKMKKTVKSTFIALNVPKSKE